MRYNLGHCHDSRCLVAKVEYPLHQVRCKYVKVTGKLSRVHSLKKKPIRSIHEHSSKERVNNSQELNKYLYSLQMKESKKRN